MIVIAIQNPKGGVAKTTTAVNLAGGFQHLYGLKAAIADTDPQRSACEWAADNDSEQGAPVKVIELRTIEEISNIRTNPDFSDYDVILVDGCADGFRQLRAASNVSDLVLFVSQPSPADIKPLGEAVDLVSGRDCKVAFLMTNVDQYETDLKNAVVAALKDAYDLPVFDSHIRRYKAYKETFGVGETIFCDSSYRKPQADIQAVINDCLDLLEIEMEVM